MNVSLIESVGLGFLVGVFVFFVAPLWGSGGTGAYKPCTTTTKLVNAIIAGLIYGAYWYFRGYHFFQNRAPLRAGYSSVSGTTVSL